MKALANIFCNFKKSIFMKTIDRLPTLVKVLIFSALVYGASALLTGCGSTRGGCGMSKNYVGYGSGGWPNK